MSQSVRGTQDGHTEDKVAHERNRSRVTEEVHAALVIQGCWRAFKSTHHRPRKQTASQQAGLNVAKAAHEAPGELSPADAFEAALAEALARPSLQESARAGNSKETGQGRFTLTPPNTPALGTSPPTVEPDTVTEARAGRNPPEMAMHAIPEGTAVEDRAALPAPTVQPNKAESAAATAATSRQAPFNDQATDLASAVMPEQFNKLFKEPTSAATTVGSQGPEAVQLGREWSVPVAGTLHVAKALENVDTQGEQAGSQAEASQDNSEPKVPPRAGTPNRKSNGYTTDVEDEAAGGPKGDLQSHISRNIATPATEATGGTAEARALASYERFPPLQGPVQEAESREEAGERQLGGQPPKQQEQTSVGVTGASEEQVVQPVTGRRIVLQEQAGAQALAPTSRPAPRRQQVQEAVMVGGPAAVGGGDWGAETVLLGGPAAVPARSATRSIPVAGPLTPEIRRECKSTPLMVSTPQGQWWDYMSGAAGARGSMQPSVGQTAVTVGSPAWGPPEEAWQASSAGQASRTRAGGRAGKLKDAAYGVLHALDDVAHAATRARGNLADILTEADKNGDGPACETWQHGEAQPMQLDIAPEMPGREDMLGAMEKLSDALRTAYSQENNTAGQGLDENAGVLQQADSGVLGLESVDTPRMPERGLGIRAQENLRMEEEEVWAAATVELTPQKAPAVSPCSDNPMAAAAARIAGGLVKLLIFSGLALSMWTCLAFILDYDQHVEHALPPA